MRRLALFALVLSCGGSGTEPWPVAPQQQAKARPKEDPTKNEVHLKDVRQLTFGGENAEAYWSWSGDQLILQSRAAEQACDRIYTMKIGAKEMTPVSSGKGATTCSYFLPGDRDVIFASTHLAGDACPPKPDRSKGYVWAVHEGYDIFRAKADGSNVVRLTDAPGYDAEGTVCKKDGSIVFTSARDGDLELYRMDADGKNQRRITDAPGYDGGAFFDEDCTKIVWRASRPKGKDLEEYKALLAQHLVRPTKLEIWVANADGSDARQITYLDAASFAPYFFPGGKRVIFSSNYGDPSGREFDLWAIDAQGTNLERLTYAPGFDGFPMFSPDGKQLAFSSNRATAPGAHDTNVFVAKWSEAPSRAIPGPADRTLADDAWLSAPEREGRGVGSIGLLRAGELIERRFVELGLQPVDKTMRQTFDVPTGMTGGATLTVGGVKLEGAAPLGFSAPQIAIEAPLVLAGFGVSAEGYDDYKGLDVKDKIVVARRFVPDAKPFESAEAKRRHGDLRHKAWLAREKGAKGIIIVDLPQKGADGKIPDEAKLPTLTPETTDEGIAAIAATRASMAPILERLTKKEAVRAKIDVRLITQSSQAFNVVGRWRATVPDEQKIPGAIVIGAHYDHLGTGGHGSLAPDAHAVHPGADDNASGTATLLEVARAIAGGKMKLRRDVIFVAFSGEERGVLGSTFFVKNPLPTAAPADIAAMINMDMVGRLRDNKLEVLGHDTADEWQEMIEAACSSARVECVLAKGGGYGPSDHAPFYAAGVPVVHLFTGAEPDYHKPSDTWDKLNAAGMAQIAQLVTDLTQGLSQRPGALTLRQAPSPPPMGDMRSFGASLGTIPDYAGPPRGTSGMLLAGVRPGGAADQAGMKRGDILIKLGKHDIGSVEDLMYVLAESKPGEKTKATVTRDGKPLVLDVTFQEAKSPR